MRVRDSETFDEDRSLEPQVRAEQIRVIYKQAPPALLISVLVAGLICFILWDLTDHAVLGAWFALLTVLALVRLGLVRRFRSRDRDASEMPVWERAFVASLVSTGVVWGVGAWLIMPADSVVHQAVVYFFLMGMAGGAVASYSAHSACTYITICSVLLPATAWFVLQDEIVLRAMAAGGLVYVGAAYRATRTLAFFLRRTFHLSHKLQAAHEREQQLARTDELTGMKNRRAFYESGALAFDQAKRYERPLSVVMLDIDDFKAVNDTWGHAAGDKAIQAVAAVIRNSARAADVAGRLGGDEFAILLPETTGKDAAAQAERLRRAVGALSIRDEDADITFTCSFGVAERAGEAASLEALISQADAALYVAKAQGRNGVASYSRT